MERVKFEVGGILNMNLVSIKCSHLVSVAKNDVKNRST